MRIMKDQPRFPVSLTQIDWTLIVQYLITHNQKDLAKNIETQLEDSQETLDIV